jgi:putative hydrolase of the HAD superfamily
MKYILWDFDGTLAYRDGMWLDALYSIVQKNNIKTIPIETIKPFLRTGFTWHTPQFSHKELFNGKTWWEYYEEYFYGIFLKIGINKNICKDLSIQVKKEYMDIKKWFIYEDTIRALEQIKENGYKNVIVSNHIPELEELVRKIHLDEYFTKIYSSALIGYEKPNKKIYEYVLKDLSTEKDECIIIGDSFDSDIQGGIGTGIKSILVRKENTQEYKWYCKDLENIIEKLNGK